MSTGSNKNELKEIHSMLNEVDSDEKASARALISCQAVDMLKSYEHKGSMLSTGSGR